MVDELNKVEDGACVTVSGLRHVLIQYQGGGYEGCFWEWNYAYVDFDGEFHSIAHSGRKGCATGEEMQEYFKELDSRFDKVYTYALGNKKHRENFADSSNALHVKGVADWLEDFLPYDLDYAHGIKAKCAICGEYVHAAGTENMVYVDEIEGLVCMEECYFSHTCGYCGEFFAEYNDENFPSECLEGYCAYCHENNDCNCKEHKHVELEG